MSKDPLYPKMENMKHGSLFSCHFNYAQDKSNLAISKKKMQIKCFQWIPKINIGLINPTSILSQFSEK